VFFGHIFNPLFFGAQNYLDTSVNLYGLPSDKSRDNCGHHVHEFHLSIIVILVCRPNCSDATDVFVRRTIFGMSWFDKHRCSSANFETQSMQKT
jgi:hypothetical protein